MLITIESEPSDRGQQRSAIWVKAVRRHAKIEGVVVNSIQTSFVSERMVN
jgi:hypothetical protein